MPLTVKDEKVEVPEVSPELSEFQKTVVEKAEKWAEDYGYQEKVAEAMESLGLGHLTKVKPVKASVIRADVTFTTTVDIDMSPRSSLMHELMAMDSDEERNERVQDYFSRNLEATESYIRWRRGRRVGSVSTTVTDLNWPS